MKYITATIGGLLVFVLVLLVTGIGWGILITSEQNKGSGMLIAVNPITVGISVLAAGSSFLGTLKKYRKKEQKKKEASTS